MSDSEGAIPTAVHLETKGLGKKYPGIDALTDFSLRIRKDEILGLAGENGAGKSTLLKIISGVESPGGGQMLLNGKEYRPSSFRHANILGVSMVFQEQNLIPNLRVYENIFLSHEDRFLQHGFLKTKSMVAEANKYLDSFELDVLARKPVSSYSFHKRQMLEIIRAFAVSDMYGVETPLVLLDEPTAALPDEEREVLIDKIRVYSRRAVVVFVSHRLSELMELCDRIAVLRDGRLVGEVMPSTATERDIHTMMVGRTLNSDIYRVYDQSENKDKEQVVLQVDDLSVRKEYKGVSFELRKGEILGVGGLIGSGKTGLGESLFGIGRTDTGEITVNGTRVQNPSISKMMKHRMGYVPAERKEHGLIYLLPVGWNISLPSLDGLSTRGLGFLNKKRELDLIEDGITRLGVKGQRTDDCYSLSGGNQQKVVLAKWMVKNLDILILDNPTRGIDVGAKEEIYTFIRQIVNKGVSIVLISDDLLELIGLSNRIIIMKDGEISTVVDASSSSKPSEEEIVKDMV